MEIEHEQYTIEMEFRESFLHVIVGGLRVTPEIALEYWQEVRDECDRLGCSKILLEHNFVEMVTMNEMLAVIGPITSLLKGCVLAFYDHYGNYEIPEAGKVILRSHDIKMQIFQTLGEAERWLRAN